jgi:hypothetical protein
VIAAVRKIAKMDDKRAKVPLKNKEDSLKTSA